MSDGISERGHTVTYLAAVSELASAIDPARVAARAGGLAAVRERAGRLFPSLAVKQGHWESLAAASR
jgi:hypothetical protein